MDGHRALKNEEVNRVNARDFQLVLSALADDEQSFTLIIHASSNTISMSRLGPLELLARLGYEHFPGNCPFHRDRCMWRPLASVACAPFPDHFQVDRIHAAFKAHANALPEIYQRFREIANMLSLPDSDEIDLFPEIRRLQIPHFQPRPGAIPSWASTELPAHFFEVCSRLQAIQEESTRLRVVAGLLWETGEALVEGVCAAFSSLEYRATRTPRGYTYDVTVELDATRRLLIEVTGIDGPLKKDSNKIAQALQTVQRDANDGDRVVVALNTYRTQSLQDRASMEEITQNALNLLAGLKVNILTTVNLFGIWKQSLTDLASAKARIDALHAHDGGCFVG